MNDRYDVLVVGARCAGAALAAFLARAGARVLMIDRAALPSDHVISTHSIHAPGMDVLDELGVGARVRASTPPMRVIRFEIDGVAVDGAYPEGRTDYCPRRRRLDGWLQEAAAAAGVEIRDETTLVELLRDGERVAGARVRHGGREYEVRAGLVAGADGRHSKVAELVHAREYLGYDGPRAGYWAYWPASPAWKNQQFYPFDQYVAHTGTGARIIFQTDDGELILGTAPALERAKTWRGDLTASYLADVRSDPTLGPLTEGNAPSSDVRGTISERYFFREPVGPGWALAGDAGHHKDFFVGDGITEALRQARALSKAILAADEAALRRWWRERDVEALPLFRFAEELGASGPRPALSRRLFEQLARQAGGGEALVAVFLRDVLPNAAVPVTTVLRAVVAGLAGGEFSVVPEFFAHGRRIGQVEKELKQAREALRAEAL